MRTRPRVIAYVRVSTEQQAESGNSLEAQKSRLKLYATLHEVDIIEVVVDAGESASTLARPGLQRALEMIEQGQAQGLLVVKLDRLTRSVRDLGELVDRYFRDGKACLLSVSEHIDTSSAAGRMVLNILTTVAQWEREAAAERTAAVMAHLKSTGKFTGGFPPYGYGADEDGNLIENPEEQAIILRARALRAEGMSLRGIAAQLPPNRKGETFDPKQIQRMCA